MMAVRLLPMTAAEVAAASGAQLVPRLVDPQSAFRLLMLGYALWAFLLLLALSIFVVLVLRPILHEPPHKDMAASSRLAVGPIVTGAPGLLPGQNTPAVFAAVGIPAIGIVAQGIGSVVLRARASGAGPGSRCSSTTEVQAWSV